MDEQTPERSGSVRKLLNYPENVQLVAGLEFQENIGVALEWAKQNRSQIRTEEGKGRGDVVTTITLLGEAGRLEGINRQEIYRRAGAYDLYLHNQELVDQVDFQESEDRALQWIKENRQRVQPMRAGQTLSLGYVADMLSEAGKLEGVSRHVLVRKANAYELYLHNQELIDPLDFEGDEEKAFEWVVQNREHIQSRREGQTPSPTYLALALEQAGKLEGVSRQNLQRRVGAYELYLRNRKLIDPLDFQASQDKAFEWIKKNQARVQPMEQGQSVGFSTVAVMLAESGKLEGIGRQRLLRRAGGYELYLRNRKLIDPLDFQASQDKAFEWIKQNRGQIHSKDSGEQLSLGTISDALGEAGKLDGIDEYRLQRRCTAYELYMHNQKLVDQVDFQESEDRALQWMKQNRGLIKGKDPQQAMSLTYISDMLAEAGKLKGIDRHKLQRRAGAYDLYLHNQKLVDQVDFKGDMDQGIGWMKQNRDNLVHQQEDQLSLGYMASMLREAGKLGGINYNTFQIRAAAYDYYLSKRADFLVAGLDSLQATGKKPDWKSYRKAVAEEFEDPESKLFYRLDDTGKVSESYLRSALREARPEILQWLKKPYQEMEIQEVRQMWQTYSTHYGKITDPGHVDLPEINRRIREIERSLEAGTGSTTERSRRRLKK